MNKPRIFSKPVGISAAFILLATYSFAAPTLDPNTQPAWTTSPFTLADTNLASSTTKAYRPWYENGAWQGDVLEYDVAVDGTRTRPDANWEAGAVFTAKQASVTDYWKASAADGGRQIITTDGSAQVAFRWDTISATQRTALDSVSAADVGLTGSYDSPVLNYARGDNILELPTGSKRQRYSLLGDIINSNITYVGAPQADYLLTGYSTYKNTNLSRSARLYVGANDGMLHVFDASSGEEVYAYVPSMLLNKLSSLSVSPYSHTYYVDGQLASGDAFVDSSWATILAGGMGAGAKGLFVLDVTDPDLSVETASTGDDKKVLFEKTDSSLGYIHGRPRIALLPDDKWYVLSGNGYGSTDDSAKLYKIDLSSGVSSTINTGVSGNNGLSAPAVIDTDNDGKADYAYAGDLLGNLWKFDLTNSTSRKLFSGSANKPITVAPDIASHPSGGNLIYFGTGSLLSSADASDVSQQSIYAVWDEPGSTATLTVSNLLPQTLAAANHATGISTLVATATTQNWSTYKGWKVDLPASGERLLGDPQLRGERLQFITDTAAATSWFIQLDWLTGGDSGNILFDLNSSNALDNGDTVTVDSVSRTPVAISLGDANFSRPTFARLSNGVDVVFVNGLEMPTEVNPPIVGTVVGGVQGGHFDVDTDLTLGGSTNEHKHEYDDKYNTTEIDYFEMVFNNQIDNIGLATNKQFVVVLANADLSTGGALTIGAKQWTVVEYQEMVQQKLTDWDGVSALVDDDGDSLLYSLDSITGVSGTMKMSFNDRSIIEGGLIGTATGCVKSNDAYDTTGRYRNGALTVQVLDASLLLAGNQANNIWSAQVPVDLTAGMVGGGVLANFSDDSGFLYESTVFWHYDGACYGEADWADDFAEATTPVTSEHLADLFPEYASNQDAAELLLIQLLSVTCDKGTGTDCKKESEYKDAEKKLKDLLGKNTWKQIKKLLDKIQVGISGTDGSTTPSDVVDSSWDISPAVGPNYSFGRRTWIDLRD